MQLAYWFYIFDKKVHENMADKSAYGRTKISGTSIYKGISVNKNTGVHLMRNEAHVGKFAHLRAPIKHYKSIPIPDQQTRMASLLGGKVDVFLDPTPDTMRGMANNKNFKSAVFPSRYLIYIFLDAKGRSAQKVFKDIRVRQAFFKAIDREALINTYVQGGTHAVRPDAVCFKEVVACSYTTKPLGYDPEGAKRLLAEAGYPNGLEIAFNHNATTTFVAAAVAGQLRKVGFRPKIRRIGTIGLQIKLRGRGELTSFMARYPNFAQPNAANIMSLYFGANRDYTGDPVILAALKKGPTVMDPKERAKVYQKAFDRVNEMSYIYPFSEKPNIYLHSNEIEMKPGLITLAETRPTDYFWAK